MKNKPIHLKIWHFILFMITREETVKTLDQFRKWRGGEQW